MATKGLFSMNEAHMASERKRGSVSRLGQISFTLLELHLGYFSLAYTA